ncbi:MAG: hypothetical protein HY606_14480, partial [Planctomycetes bacterium]|nr:hypothetical protein [Planctomycetota bacterium]
MKGLRQMFIRVTNELYRHEIRIFHRPLDFFKELGISIDSIENTHKAIRDLRAEPWAKENQSNPTKYNLFMDNSKQVLNYAIFRWGVPLCVPLLLEKDLQKVQKEIDEPLIEYIERHKSAELMSQEIKDNERYGLGKSIGDKAG